MGLFDRLFGKKESKVIIREITAEEAGEKEEKAPVKEKVEKHRKAVTTAKQFNKTEEKPAEKQKERPKKSAGDIKPKRKERQPRQELVYKEPVRLKYDEGWSPEEFTVEEKEGFSRFHDFDIPLEIMRGIHECGFTYCTDIQKLSLPSTFEGKDIFGKAQTGTGKTAAFLLTALRSLLTNKRADNADSTPRALILAPTRELAIQIEADANNLGMYTGLDIISVYGGMDYAKQLSSLKNRKLDLVVATPGRLIDFVDNGHMDIGSVEMLIIDEADRMLDMGFIPDIKKIIAHCPEKQFRQTLLFSATMDEDVLNLASRWTVKPVSVEVEPDVVAVEAIEQKAVVLTSDEKYDFLYNLITKDDIGKAIVFCNRRDVARELADTLKAAGVACELLSGDVTQKRRIRTLEKLKSGEANVMIATDVAARGIHVDDITHVINYALPEDPELYVHRIGRTGRAGNDGIAYVLADEESGYQIPAIEEFIGKKLEFFTPDEKYLETAPRPKVPKPKRPHHGGQRKQGGGRPQRKGGYNRKRD